MIPAVLRIIFDGSNGLSPETSGWVREIMSDDSQPEPDQDPRKSDLWFADVPRRRTRGPQPGKDQAGYRMHTRVVHAGQYDDPLTGSIGTPIFQGTTFLLNEDTYRAMDEGRGRDSLVYGRYGSPSQWAVQAKMAVLEGAESSLVFSSGMAAIATTLLGLLDRGAHVITSRDVYGGTFSLLYENLHQYGMSVSFVDPTDMEEIEAAMTPNTTLFFFEALTNPLLKLVPIAPLVELARRHGCRVVIDNTFLTPYNLRPLYIGVDVVVHSATKYLGGHTDVVAGFASGSRKLIDRIWGQLIKLGGSQDPHACFLLERSLKTLALRMHAHNENALAVARFLERRPEVLRVHYPGLASHPQHDLASVMLHDQFGGMVSFEIEGGDEVGLAFMNALKIPRQAVSLGGVESLVSMPFNTTHAPLTRSERHAIGIGDGFVRLSVGIEDVQDLTEDLERAFANIKVETT